MSTPKPKKRPNKAPTGLRDQIATEAMKSIVQGATAVFQRVCDEGKIGYSHSCPDAHHTAAQSVAYADALLAELGYD